MDRVLSSDETRELELVEVLCITIEPKLTSMVVKMLPRLGEEFGHLKRIRKINGKTQLIIGRFGTAFVLDVEYVEQIEKVPKFKPLTKLQYDNWNKVWPMSFHSNSELVNLDSNELEIVLRNLDIVEDGWLLIVEPITNKIVYKIPSTHECHIISENGYTLDHDLMVAIHKQSEQELVNRTLNSTKQYLLNNLDVYLKTEPCIMCSMALVHSRVNRVFYIKENEYGALGTLFSLHCEPSLNHKFLVFKKQ